MQIFVSNEQKVLSIKQDSFKKLIRYAAQLEKERFDEVSLYFVEKKAIKKLHQDYFNDPSSTDCISFPLDGPEEQYRVLGDIFVCPEVAMEYTQKNGGSPLNETYLYALHGLLHLFGYDDIEEKDYLLMKEKEKLHMENLKQKGLIRD